MAKDQDGAATLEELSPVILKQFAIYIPGFDPYGSPHYKDPYRRYATVAHMKSAAKGFRSTGQHDLKFYQFNFDTDSWEEYHD